VSIDEQQHIALPSLYGAPAYARPPVLVPTTERPFDPDELPIAAAQTDEEREFTSALPAHAWAPGGAKLGGDKQPGSDEHHGLRPRRFRLRGITGRVLGGG
jgi:hypothetical protein